MVRVRICRLVIRAAVAGALAVGLFAANSGSANAIGDNCDGSQVIRCVYIAVGSSGGLSARAYIYDAGGGGNYDVAVNNVRLEYLSGAGWAVLPGSGVGDYDGWHPTSDYATGPTVSCTSGSVWLRAAAYMQYRGSSSGAYTIYSTRVQVSC